MEKSWIPKLVSIAISDILEWKIDMELFATLNNDYYRKFKAPMAVQLHDKQSHCSDSTLAVNDLEIFVSPERE